MTTPANPLPNDLYFQQLSTVQNNLQPMPATFAAATDMNDVIRTFLTFITGTGTIATIDPIVTGSHMIVLIFTNGNPGGVVTGGNIKAAVDPAQNAPVILIWDSITALWWPGKLALG